MRIAVVDGQGGGIGKAIVDRIKKANIDNVEILALGTNSFATDQMLKAGAHMGATGENAIIYNMDKVDIVCGVIAILSANSMLGELTPSMATAISSSSAFKVLLPINRCGIHVVGVVDSNLNTYIDEVVVTIERYISEKGEINK